MAEHKDRSTPTAGFETYPFTSQVAFHDADGAVTYEQAREKVYALARVLASFGLRPGDVAAFVAPASTWSFLLQHAINHLGAVHLEVPSRLPAAYQAEIIRDAGARLLIHDPAIESEGLLELVPWKEKPRLLALGPASPGRGQDVLAAAATASPRPFRPRRLPGHAVSLDLSGATTGVPKAAERQFPVQCAWQLPLRHSLLSSSQTPED